MAISKVPQDNVTIVGRSPLAERARAEQILRRAKEEAPVKKLNSQGKTMGQIAGEVASRTSVKGPTPLKASRPHPGAPMVADGNWPTPRVKVNSNPVPSRTSTLQGAGGVLGGQHAGGHSDVMGAINMGGFTVKTPIIKPTSTKNK